MAERVVDLLEAVEVEQHQREAGGVALRGQERLLEAIVEEPTVREPGERVVEGELLDLLHLAAEARRNATEQREQGEVQRQEHELQHADDGQQALTAGLHDRLVVLRQRENSRGLVRADERHRYEDLEHLASVHDLDGFPDVAAGECGARVRRVHRRGAYQLPVRRVGNPAVAAVELQRKTVSDEDVRRDGAVERACAIPPHRLREVAATKRSPRTERTTKRE